MSAQTALVSAQDTLAALHRAHAAHALQKTLAAGTPCPVCEQTVSRLPALQPVSDLDDAQQHVNGARAEADAEFRQALIADLEATLAREGYEPERPILDALRRRFADS